MNPLGLIRWPRRATSLERQLKYADVYRLFPPSDFQANVAIECEFDCVAGGNPKRGVLIVGSTKAYGR